MERLSGGRGGEGQGQGYDNGMIPEKNNNNGEEKKNGGTVVQNVDGCKTQEQGSRKKYLIPTLDSRHRSYGSHSTPTSL